MQELWFNNKNKTLNLTIGLTITQNFIPLFNELSTNYTAYLFEHNNTRIKSKANQIPEKPKQPDFHSQSSTSQKKREKTSNYTVLNNQYIKKSTWVSGKKKKKSHFYNNEQINHARSQCTKQEINRKKAQNTHREEAAAAEETH